MSFVDEIKNCDPDSERFAPFEVRAKAEASKVIQHILTKVKHDISNQKYTTYDTYKEWNGAYNLITYKFDSAEHTDNSLWEISHVGVPTFFDINYNYPSHYIHYRYGTEILAEAEYFSDLVAKELEKEGFVCRIEKQTGNYQKGFF